MLVTFTVKNVSGTPAHFIRWGTNGLAFTTESSAIGSSNPGAVYLIQSSFVTTTDKRIEEPSENVRMWWRSSQNTALKSPSAASSGPQQ